ncbi:hypothetical protein C8R44DRAFT_849365 [Mycena epipterygia]|nr:hypothetical protein C8R44DRAFT_849365 [Mycena epipterygia]
MHTRAQEQGGEAQPRGRNTARASARITQTHAHPTPALGGYGKALLARIPALPAMSTGEHRVTARTASDRLCVETLLVDEAPVRVQKHVHDMHRGFYAAPTCADVWNKVARICARGEWRRRGARLGMERAAHDRCTEGALLEWEHSGSAVGAEAKAGGGRREAGGGRREAGGGRRTECAAPIRFRFRQRKSDVRCAKGVGVIVRQDARADNGVKSGASGGNKRSHGERNVTNGYPRAVRHVVQRSQQREEGKYMTRVRETHCCPGHGCRDVVGRPGRAEWMRYMYGGPSRSRARPRLLFPRPEFSVLALTLTTLDAAPHLMKYNTASFLSRPELSVHFKLH